jgi:uncharacterized caspase-like protein
MSTMRRPRWILLAVLVSVFAWGPEAYAQKRVALVIGNSAYRHAPRLNNPKNDAADMAAVLKTHGFEVIQGSDLDKIAFDQKVHDFTSALMGADAGVFFYAGHGLQLGGQNYLVPVDAKAADEAGLDLEMVRVDVVHRIMERRTETNILFLDACRDNPLARNLERSMGTRSADVGRGLARMEAGVGTLISFSTQPGNIALDGVGRNSPFTGALVKHLAVPTDDLSAILIDVRNEVMQATKNKQVPWEHVALRARFYFSPPTQSPRARAGEAAGSWALVKDSTDVRALDAFRRQYRTANPLYDRLAEARIEQLTNAADAAKRKGEEARDRERLTLLQQQEEEEKKKKRDEDAAQRDSATSVLSGSGKSFHDCPDCPEMLVLPAGEFMMGSTRAEIAALVRELGQNGPKREHPQHKVTLARSFAVSKFEVTFAEWDACVAAGGCRHKPMTRVGGGIAGR